MHLCNSAKKKTLPDKRPSELLGLDKADQVLYNQKHTFSVIKFAASMDRSVGGCTAIARQIV